MLFERQFQGNEMITINWEEMLENHILNKQHKIQLYVQSSNSIINNSVESGKRLEQDLTREDTYMSTEHL